MPPLKPKKVVKVLMFVWRKKDKKKEFLVLHRFPQKDWVALTGHCNPDETYQEAVRREIPEELGVQPRKILDLNYAVTVFLPQHNAESEEHAFLVEIGNQKVSFLEYKADVFWCSYPRLLEKLTYPNQQAAARKIQD